MPPAVDTILSIERTAWKQQPVTAVLKVQSTRHRRPGLSQGLSQAEIIFMTLNYLFIIYLVLLY